MESILPIVASQRERFKIRNMELEAVSNKLELMFLFFVFLLLLPTPDRLRKCPREFW